MNAIQMNISAMISIMMVPNIPPAVLNAQLTVFAVSTLLLTLVESHRNTIFIPHMDTTSVIIVSSLLSQVGNTPRRIVLVVVHISLAITQPPS
jgi:hypothetical protein